MATFDILLERNQHFAAHHFPKDLPLMPTLRAMIIGCVDPRVDPALLLGLGLVREDKASLQDHLRDIT